MLMLTSSAVFRYCSPLLTRLTLASPLLTLAHPSLPSTADKAAMLTFLNRNRFRVDDYSGQTTSCYRARFLLYKANYVSFAFSQVRVAAFITSIRDQNYDELVAGAKHGWPVHCKWWSRWQMRPQRGRAGDQMGGHIWVPGLSAEAHQGVSASITFLESHLSHLDCKVQASFMFIIELEAISISWSTRNLNHVPGIIVFYTRSNIQA